MPIQRLSLQWGFHQPLMRLSFYRSCSKGCPEGVALVRFLWKKTPRFGFFDQGNCTNWRERRGIQVRVRSLLSTTYSLQSIQAPSTGSGGQWGRNPAKKCWGVSCFICFCSICFCSPTGSKIWLAFLISVKSTTSPRQCRAWRYRNVQVWFEDKKGIPKKDRLFGSCFKYLHLFENRPSSWHLSHERPSQGLVQNRKKKRPSVSKGILGRVSPPNQAYQDSNLFLIFDFPSGVTQLTIIFFRGLSVNNS